MLLFLQPTPPETVLFASYPIWSETCETVTHPIPFRIPLCVPPPPPLIPLQGNARDLVSFFLQLPVGCCLTKRHTHANRKGCCEEKNCFRGINQIMKWIFFNSFKCLLSSTYPSSWYVNVNGGGRRRVKLEKWKIIYVFSMLFFQFKSHFFYTLNVE